MKNIAVYPGTFDPITYGHVDLISRAAQIFDQVVVAIAVNTNKKPLFDLNQRVELSSQVLSHLPNVTVQGFECLLVDFVKQQQARIILRGLRAVSDFDYEFQLAGINRKLNHAIETIFLLPGENYSYVSSSFVREIATLGGDVKQFVPEVVLEALQKKLWR